MQPDKGIQPARSMPLLTQPLQGIFGINQFTRLIALKNISANQARLI
jgi:hypothetical protein